MDQQFSFFPVFEHWRLLHEDVLKLTHLFLDLHFCQENKGLTYQTQIEKSSFDSIQSWAF